MEWFGADEAWERPTPPVGHSDVRLGVVLLAISALLLELSRSFGDFSQAAAPWQQYLSLASICATFSFNWPKLNGLLSTCMSGSSRPRWALACSAGFFCSYLIFITLTGWMYWHWI